MRIIIMANCIAPVSPRGGYGEKFKHLFKRMISLRIMWALQCYQLFSIYIDVGQHSQIKRTSIEDILNCESYIFKRFSIYWKPDYEEYNFEMRQNKCHTLHNSQDTEVVFTFLYNITSLSHHIHSSYIWDTRWFFYNNFE